MSNREEIIKEYARCVKDPVHAIENYLQTFDLTKNGFVPFRLFDHQKNAIHNYETERFNILLKYRQAGASTFTSAYLACKGAFSDPTRPEKILVVANKLETAIELLGKIIDFLKQFPLWVGIAKPDGKFTKESQKHIKLLNGSEYKAVASSPDALRGYVPTFMVLDEAAFIEGGSAFWSACLASLSTGGKATLISTPRGLDEIYYAQYEGAIEGTNNFKITEMKWYADPRYNTDLKFIKTNDIIRWIVTPEHERTAEVILVETDGDATVRLEYWSRLISEGYQPYSDWFETMCRSMNLNKRNIAQEIQCVGGDTQITIRNKLSGIVENINIQELYRRL